MASKLQILTQTDDEEEVGLYFVVPRNLNKNDCDDDMKQAFKTAADNEYTPEWKTEESCLLLSPSKRNVFVFQTFKGAAFEHLQQFKCVSLIGPRCLTHCIMLSEPMPLVMNPSFTLSMKDLKITVSGCGVELKNKIRQKIEMMSGVFLKSLTSFTTHVVVSSVVSSKYEKALEWGVPVRTLEWVDAVWESSLKEYVFATDEKFNEYRCPPFLNLRVASTGLNVREQDQLKSTLSKYGGQYDKSLSCQVNVLVVKKSKGDKYSHAKLWGIPCVQLRWIHDCVKAGNALPTKAYEVVGTAASSPKSSNATLNFSANLSTVQCDQKTHIDETMLDSTTSSVASFCPIPRSKTPVKMPPPAPRRTPVKCRTPVKSIVQPTAPGEFKHLLAELDLNQTRRAGPFLDGCGIYIVGWNTEEEEILRKVLKCSGATRFSDLNDRVSHILVGNLEKPFLRVLKNLSHTPHVVNIKWLIESLAQKSPAQEEHFYCMASENMNVSEAPSPLSKKGMALLQRETFSPKKSLAVQPSSSRVTEMSPNKGKQQLLAKYTATDSSDNSISKSMSTSSRCMPPPPVPAVKSTKQPHNVSSADESDLGGSEDLTFAGLNFVIVGLENSTSYVEEELIQKYGGKVVPKSFKGVPDYAVVPLPGASLKQTATEIVTVLWLESCIEARSILPISYYHQPVVLDVNKRPLEGCVLCLSGYCGKERQFIIELASALGAVCQEVFVRKSKNSAKASSHLICKSSEGSEKFNAAVKWFRPAVYHSWLLACAASGTQVPEKDHLVDPSQEVKPLLINDSNSVTSDVSSRCATSKRVESATVAALRLLPCFKTPERTPVTYDKEEVDRILNYVPSPNPYEVKTPPVPLGISENPTPGESKWVQKWLDRVPGKLPKPSPSPNPRRDSTPLHELRKKILEKHTISSPELMKILHGEDEDCDTSIADSAVALKNDLRNENVKSPPVACSTPTVSSCSVTSRKLFESNENDNNPNSEPIDIHLDKLNKLIATPELKVETALVSARTSNVSFIDNKCHKNQDFYDTLKDGSQPYAIKWEDPVHAKRTPKDGSARPDNQINETNEEELSTKRKSSEIAEEDEPPAKRKSSESAESSAESKKTHTINVKSFKENAHPVTHRFSFSHIDDKGDWVGIIRKLGGTVSDSSSYNPNSTHLLLAKAPVRSEKLLAFIAAGKWILHVEYLLESGKQGKFVEEEGYELGNPNGKLAVTYKANSVEDLLSKAARRWRTRVGKEEVTGAFEGFKCKILTLPDKAVPFSRLIHAGKGQVLPEDSLEQPNFCLVNLTSHKHKIQEYAKLGIPCLPVTYLYEYLTQEPPPKPESRAIEEYKVLRAKYLAEK